MGLQETLVSRSRRHVDRRCWAPTWASCFREVNQLRQALSQNRVDSNEARQGLRQLVDGEIQLTPQDGLLG